MVKKIVYISVVVLFIGVAGCYTQYNQPKNDNKKIQNKITAIQNQDRWDVYYR